MVANSLAVCAYISLVDFYRAPFCRIDQIAMVFLHDFHGFIPQVGIQN